MKKGKFGFSKSLFIAFTTTACALLLSSCSKDEQRIDQTNQQRCALNETRASSEFHWRCKQCGFLNAGWRHYCSKPGCVGEYSSVHGNLILSIINVSSTILPCTDVGGYDDSNIGNRVEIQGRLVPTPDPQPWYESYSAQPFYSELTSSSTYKLNSDYAEGAEYGWYQTTHIFYPEYHDATTVWWEYERFCLNEGQYLTGLNGQGIKAGSKAAVEAFKAYRY